MLALICLRYKKIWKARGGEESLWYILFDKTINIAVPLTIVVSFYTVLSAFVDGTSNSTTLGWLETLEKRLDSIKSFVGFFTFKPWIAAPVIATLICTDLLITYFIRPSNKAIYYKDYSKWTKRLYTFFALLCSFTFFGNELGDQVAHLRVRIDKIKAGYARVNEESERILAAEVQKEAYRKAQDSFPADVREMLNSRLVSLIELDSTKQLLCQFPKSVISVAKSRIFKNVQRLSDP